MKTEDIVPIYPGSDPLFKPPTEMKTEDIVPIYPGSDPLFKPPIEEKETVVGIEQKGRSPLDLRISHVPIQTPPKQHRETIQNIRQTLSTDDLLYLKTVSLMIATPAYGNQLTVTYTYSLLTVLAVLQDLEVECETVFLGTESLITRARNGMVAEFLGSDATHMLFIDADIGFEASAVTRLLLAKKDVISAVYPVKGYRWDKLARYIRKTPPDQLDIQTMKEVCAQYAFNLDLRGEQHHHDGYWRVLDAPTGFMMLSRTPLQYIIRKNPELKYMNESPSYDSVRSKGHFYDLFQARIDPETRRYLSEDYGFCRLCRESGIKIWVDVMNTLTHEGTHRHWGNLGKQLFHTMLAQQ